MNKSFFANALRMVVAFELIWFVAIVAHQVTHDTKLMLVIGGVGCLFTIIGLPLFVFLQWCLNAIITFWRILYHRITRVRVPKLRRSQRQPKQRSHIVHITMDNELLVELAFVVTNQEVFEQTHHGIGDAVLDEINSLKKCLRLDPGEVIPHEYLMSIFLISLYINGASLERENSCVVFHFGEMLEKNFGIAPVMVDYVELTSDKASSTGETKVHLAKVFIEMLKAKKLQEINT